MRRSFVLLVITGVLLAIYCAESVSADQTKPDQSGDTALGDDNAGRLLRSHQEADDGIADEDRGPGSMLRKVFGLRKSGFSKNDLMKALNDENSRVALYKKWDKYPVSDFKLRLEKTDKYNARERALFTEYLEGRKTVKFKLDERKFRTFDDEGEVVDKVQRLNDEGKYVDKVERLDDAAA